MTRRFHQAAGLFVLLLLLYTLLRAGFYTANHAFFAGIAEGEIAMAFVRGLRFDVAALLLVNVPLLALFLLPGDPARWPWFRIMLFVLFCAVNIAGILLNIADFEYFATIQRRLLYEPYTQLPDILRMVPGLLRRYTALALLFVAACAAFVLLVRIVFRRAGRMRARGGIVREILIFAAVVVLTVIGIRGGLQLKPIRQTNAFVSPHMAVGYLTLNTTYTVVRSMFQPALPEYDFYRPEEVRAAIDSVLRQDGERMENPEYPFLRTTAHAGPGLRRNVVVIIMESWTSVFIGSLTGKRSITPFFDSLAARGALFTNFLANGQRSIEAVPSILTSIPGLFSTSLIGSKAEMDHFRGLGAILGEQGYTTAFLHGATTGSMGFDAFARIAGFTRYYGKEDYPNPADSLFDGVWGLDDEPFFLDAARRMDSWPKPFCATLFSLSSHDPFEIPRFRRPIFDRFTGDTEFERSLRYSDFALMQFFHAARTRPWFDSTIFVITGDHTLFGTRNSFSASFRIPLLIYAPGLVAPARIARTGSHVDILPTILDLLRLPSTHASMGRSLFDPREPRIAVVKYGPEFGIFEGEYLLVHDLERVVGLFDFRADPQHRKDLQRLMPERARSMERALLAYLQGATGAIAKDRIYPAR